MFRLRRPRGWRTFTYNRVRLYRVERVVAMGVAGLEVAWMPSEGRAVLARRLWAARASLRRFTDAPAIGLEKALRVARQSAPGEG